MRTDTAFSQATITVLVATMLALMLQARLIGSHADHPISTRGRAALAAVELFLTTTLSIVAVLVAFVLMRHLATGGPPLKPAYRHAITLLLLLPLTGLGVIAVLNRMVPYVWKSPAPERPYLEPQVDTDLLGGLVVSVLGASAAAASLLELSGQLGAQWLVLALDGAFVVASVVWMPVLSSRFNRRFARWGRARLLQRGYEELTLDVVLPGGVGWLTVKVYPPLIAAGPVFITGHDAWELKRHHDGACRHLLTNDPDEPTPIQLRFHVLPRHRGIELTTGSRLRAASRGRWYAGHERRTPEGRRGLPSGAAGVRTPTGPPPAAGFVWLSDDAVAHLSLDLAPRPRSPRLVACAGR